MLVAKDGHSLLDICGQSSKLGSLLAIIAQAINDDSVDKDDIESCVSLAWDLSTDVTSNLSSIIEAPATSDIVSTTQPTPTEDITLPHGSTIGERIRNLRKLRGMIQPQIADAVNVSTQAVCLWEYDKAVPASDKIIPLANALKCDPLWLLAGTPSDIAEES